MTNHKATRKHQAKNEDMIGAVGGTPSVLPFIGDELLSYGVEQDLLAAHEALGKVQSFLMLQPNADFIHRALARREAIQSNIIEGIECCMQEMLEAELTTNLTGMPNAADWALRYLHALNTGSVLVKTEGKFALGIELIQMLHRELMQGSSYPDAPGEIRQEQNWIGGRNVAEAKFVPPPASYIAALLGDLSRYLQHQLLEGTRQSVVVRMAIAHAQFETIHPFLDGNGRVGRMLMPLILVADGYPPLCLSAALRQHQREYYDTLLDVQKQGKWPEWIRFVAQMVRLSCEELLSTSSALLALRQSWESTLSHTKQDSSARRLAEMLIEHPVLSVNKAFELLGVSFVAANKAIRELVEQKILQEPKSARNRIFVTGQVIALLN